MDSTPVGGTACLTLVEWAKVFVSIGISIDKCSAPRTCHELVDSLEACADDLIPVDLRERLLNELLSVKLQHGLSDVNAILSKAYRYAADRYAEKIIRERNLHKF